VREQDTELAYKIISAEFTKTTHLAHHDLSGLDKVYNLDTGKASCPACGCEFSIANSDCPDCGLSFGGR